MPYINQTFEQKVSLIAFHGLGNVDIALLRDVAEYLWRTRHIPDLSRIPAELLPDAGYLIDRLTRFNVIDQVREIEILSALAPWQDQVEREASPGCRDPLAQEWGASRDLGSRCLMALLD